MSNRLDYYAAAPQAMQLLFKQEAQISQQFESHNALTLPLLALIKLRVSQINRCGFCVDMHSKEAIAQGESAERLYSLVTWRDMPCYNELEKSALAWAESLTNSEIMSDEQYNTSLIFFGESGLVELTVGVNAINSWNRIAKSFQPVVGSYQTKKSV
jgi:AhpD family alkylhydroperoxidase